MNLGCIKFFLTSWIYILIQPVLLDSRDFGEINLFDSYFLNLQIIGNLPWYFILVNNNICEILTISGSSDDALIEIIAVIITHPLLVLRNLQY